MFMETSKIFGICIIFLLGMTGGVFINYYFSNGLEIPFNNFTISSFSFFNNSNNAPLDFINENQIEVYDDRVVIFIKDASLF